MRVVSLGGCGEESRNCFLIKTSKISFMLDCGVRREVGTLNRVYPDITEEIAKSISFVFLSHSHEDHCAALPYLYYLGFDGFVYCSEETSKAAKSFMKKWYDFSVKTSNVLPFGQEYIDAVKFKTIGFGENCINGVKTCCGRSGHIKGSLWAQFLLEGQKLLYTGDTTNLGLLLDSDSFPQSDVLVCDSAYAGASINQSEQYEKIANEVFKTLSFGGSVLLPVPGNGRGIDIALYLSSRGIKVFTDKSIINNSNTLFMDKKWCKPSVLWDEIQNLHEIGTDINNKVIVAPDGMLTTGSALECFNKLKQDSKSLVIITGHAAKGTVGNSVFNETFRIENKIKIQAEKVTVKVHPDSDDVIQICKQVKPKEIMLFHAPKENCTELESVLKNNGIKVL